MRSSFFNISNGVRQGKILSPKLFFVYMDDLSNLLISSDVGCILNNIRFNLVFYGDDLCLMAPCATALQELLNIGHRYSIIADLNFNELNFFVLLLLLSLLSYYFQNYTLTTSILYTDSLKTWDLFLPTVIRLIVLCCDK